MRKMKDLLGLSLVVCLLSSVGASAHTLWLNASDYTPEIYPGRGASTKITSAGDIATLWTTSWIENDLKNSTLSVPDAGSIII